MHYLIMFHDVCMFFFVLMGVLLESQVVEQDPTVLRLQHYRQTIVYSQKLGIVYAVRLNG